MAGRSDGGGGAASQTGSKARLRPSVPNLRAFRSCNPSHLPEISMDSNQLYLTPPAQQRSGYVSPLRTVRTIKEYDQEIEHLRKENFRLKLQLYFLEESIDKKFDLTSRDILKVNVQLKIETETLQTELNEKNRLLHNALSVMETQEKKHTADLKHSQEIQSKLEEQISSMKQALSRLQGIRDEGRYSEAYKLAFELEDSIPGKRVSDQEKSLDEAKLEREKLMNSVALKDEELQEANTRIEEQVNKIKDLEEKIRRRSIAIQGLVQMFKHKDDPKQPLGVLQAALQNAVEAATGGNENTVIASMQEITAELNKLLISSGRKEFVDLSLEETNYLKSELSHKVEEIQALQAQLSQQSERMKTLEKNIHLLESGSKKRSQESTSTKEIEQECDNYYQAIREKDSFIQELLNERATIASEHEKTVQSLMSNLLNKDQALKNLEQKLKNGSLGEDYESLEIQEQFTGKEIGDFRKQIIDKLNAELAHCHEQLKAAKQESNSKDQKLIELSSRANQLENQLFQIRERLQELKKSHDEKEQSIEKYSLELEALSKEFITKKENFAKLVHTLVERDKSLESWQKAYKDLENEYQKLKQQNFEHDLLHKTSIEESDNKEKLQMFTNLTQVEDLQDSLKDSSSEPVETIDNQLHIIHSSETNADSELPENSNASSLSGINFINEPGSSFEAEPKTVTESLENNQGTSNNMPESNQEKDDLRISVCFKVKEKSIDSELLLLQKMEYDKEQFEQEELQQEIKKQKNEMCRLERLIHEQEDIAIALREDKKQLQLEVTEKTTEVNLLRLGCNELEQQVITLQGELHRTVAKADELERIIQENKGKPKGPLLKTSVFSQTEETANGQQSENILQEGENGSNYFELQSSKPQELMNPSLTTFGQSGDIGELKEEICVLVLTIEQKDKELQIQKKKMTELEMQLHEIQKEHIFSANQFNTTYPPELVTLHHRLSQSHDVSSLLQQHLEELIKFFEQLLKYDGNGEFDLSFMTPENISRFISFLGESLELSQNLMQNLTICEESVVFDHEEKTSTALSEKFSEVPEGGQLSIANSPPVSECTQQIEADEGDAHNRKDQLEGSTLKRQTSKNSLQECENRLESRLSNVEVFEKALENKMMALLDQFQKIQDSISDLAQLKQQSYNSPNTLDNISDGIGCLQSTLIDAVKEVKMLKEIAAYPHDPSLVQEVKEHTEEILNKISDADQLKENLIKERRAREIAEQTLSECREELASFKTELKQVNSDLLHKEKSNHYLISDEVSFPEKLTEFCNEETKINEMQKLQCQLVEEQENLIILKKQKDVTENENKHLVIENENLQKCILEDQKQIKVLYKQITDFNNQTWKQKCELEQLHMTLNSEREHLELISKEKNELDIKNRNLTNGTVEFQKQLEYEEKRLQQMMSEKSEISQKLYNETVEKQNLLDLVRQLENKNLCLEKESNKYKTDYESTDAMCIQLTNELKQIKDKLKKLEFKCRQCENDLSKVSDDKDNLQHGKQMLEEEVQSQHTKILELTKQNSEVKRRFQEKINDFNELEREKISVLDQLKKLQIEAKQMETSYQRLVEDNNDLTDKLDHLERQLKDKELIFQKREEHLKLKISSSQDEVKQKELVIKDLERKIEILQEHMNDQQLQQNQNAMALKELEEEKQNQASLYQKQLKKNDYQQRLADDKIEDLQDQIFHLKQQIKDKESNRKRVEDEKNDIEKELSSLKHDLRNKDSMQKQLKQKMKMLEDQVYDLQQQLMDKDLLINKLEEEKQNLKKNIIEKEQNLNKIDSSSKTFEEKLFYAENTISELQQQLKDTETAKEKVEKENEDIFGQMLHLQNEMKIKDIDLKKSNDEIKVLTNQLSVKEKWLNEKDKYYKKLEGEKEDFRKQTGSGSEKNELLSPQDNVKEIPTETESFYEKNFCSKASVTIATDDVTKEIQNKQRSYSLKSLSHNSNAFINEIKTLQEELSIAKESILILEEEKKSLSHQIVNPPFKAHSVPLVGKLQEANDTYKKRVEELEQMIKKKDTFLREIKDDLHSSHILLLQNKAQFNTLETENLYYKKQVEALNEKLNCSKNEQNSQEEVEIYLTPEKMSDVQKQLKSKITELEKGIKDQAIERKEIQEVNNSLLQENLNIKGENEQLQQQLLDVQLILKQRPIHPSFTKPVTDSLQEQLPDSHFMKMLEEKDLLFKKSVSLKKKLEEEVMLRKNLQKENEALKVALSSLQQKWQNNPVQEKVAIDKKLGNESMEYAAGPDADLNDADKISRLEKQVSNLMQKLKELESLNRYIQLELQAYQEMSQEKTHNKVSSSDTEAASQSLIPKLLIEMRQLRAELGKVYNQNNLLRKKLDQTSLKMQSVGKITSKKVPVKGDHSSERESTPSSTDGTVTLSRSASLSHTSKESINRTESSRIQKLSKEKAEGLLSVRRHKKQYHDIDAHPTREKDGYFTSELQKNGAESENLPESVVQRSHFSSPDLGIESDPNHDISAPELLEREDNSHWRFRKSTQITPDIPAEFDNQVEDLHTAELDALQTILGSPLSKGSSLRAVGIVQDYELLKREMEESLVEIKGMAARVKDRLQSLVITASPNKNMEYITLKAIHSSCHNVELCLQQAQRLVANFWVSTLPTSGEPADGILLKQNFELKEQIQLLQNQMSERSKELQEAMVHLKQARLSKDVIEKAIVKQLNKTKKVVKQAERNLQERDRRYQLASQNQASHSSHTKP